LESYTDETSIVETSGKIQTSVTKIKYNLKNLEVNMKKSSLVSIAKIVAEDNGVKLAKSKIALLESIESSDSVDYLMVEDTRNGKQYQMWKHDEVWTFQEYIQADDSSDDSSVELTELEAKVVKAIPSEGTNSVLWTDCYLEDLNGVIDSKELPDVLASLIKKGFIYMDGKGKETAVALEDAGVDWLIAQGIIDEDGKLVKEQEIVEDVEIVGETQENKEETKKMENKKGTKKSGTRVILRAFTGMWIGEFDAVKVGKNLEVTTKSGLCIFDAKTLVQKNAKNPRFANKIEIIK
jgi:hypothetical protein